MAAAMDSKQLIDAQFDRAVQIVQSLPKTGPIQTGYEEKLAMYSLYKQATVGNVKGTRPAMWDMLGRAKWDAWAKHKDLDSCEAKWLYVDELLRVLRRYSDKTVARDLVAELESYSGDPSNIMLSGSFSKSHESDSDSDSEGPSPSQRRISQSFQAMQQQQRQETAPGEAAEDAEDDEVRELGAGPQTVAAANLNQSLLGRPQSSLSTQRYRTPMGSMAMSPPPAPLAPAPQYPTNSTGLLHHQSHQQMYTQQMPIHVQPQSIQHIYGPQALGMHVATSSVPNVQPMPSYETPSAFPGPSPPISSSSLLPTTPGMSALTNISGSGASAFTNLMHPHPANMYPGHASYHSGSAHNVQSQLGGQGQGLLDSGITGPRSPLERAMENAQAHITALQERMEMLESQVLGGSPYASRSSFGGSNGPMTQRSPQRSPYASYFGSGNGRGRPGDGSLWAWMESIDEEYFGWEHMGLWSVMLAPMARLTKFLGRILAFLLVRRRTEGAGRGNGNNAQISPALAVLRRLLLDASFVLALLFVGRKLWRRSGIRRQEVLTALAGVWGAIVGRGPALARQLVDRGVQAF